MAQYIAFIGTYNEQIYDTETKTIDWTHPIIDGEGEYYPQVIEANPNLMAEYKGKKIWRKIVK